MIKRIEFTLNLDDPVDAALFERLSASLRHRRAGTLIRQALTAFLLDCGGSQKAMKHIEPLESLVSTPSPVDVDATTHIVDQSAAMFGF